MFSRYGFTLDVILGWRFGEAGQPEDVEITQQDAEVGEAVVAEKKKRAPAYDFEQHDPEILELVKKAKEDKRSYLDISDLIKERYKELGLKGDLRNSGIRRLKAKGVIEE